MSYGQDAAFFGQRPPIEVFFLDVESVESTDYRKN
jgi:hypothetical protein